MNLQIFDVGSSTIFNALRKHLQGKPYEIPCKDGKNLINALPSEIFRQISSYLDYKERAKMKKVCKLWNSLISRFFPTLDHQRILEVAIPFFKPFYYPENKIGNKNWQMECSIHGRWNKEEKLELTFNCDNLAQKAFQLKLKYETRRDPFNRFSSIPLVIHSIQEVKLTVQTGNIKTTQMTVIQEVKELLDRKINNQQNSSQFNPIFSSDYTWL